MEGYIGEIRWFAATFEPRNWAYCDGRLLSIAQNSALFSILGTTYGGNGIQTFALPDFRGRTAVSSGQGAGLSNYVEGEKTGNINVTLISSNLPPHNHPVTGTVTPSGGGGGGDSSPVSNYPANDGNLNYATGTALNAQSGNANFSLSTTVTGNNLPVSIEQPYLGMNYVVCMYGIYPSRN